MTEINLKLNKNEDLDLFLASVVQVHKHFSISAWTLIIMLLSAND